MLIQIILGLNIKADTCLAIVYAQKILMNTEKFTTQEYINALFQIQKILTLRNLIIY